jgi:hypothetical protein
MEDKFEFVERFKKELAPIKVTVDLEFRKQKYYLIVDGTATYADPATWDEHWTGFDAFASYRFRQYVKSKPKVLAPARVEFKLGSLLDIIKQA